MTRQVPLLIWVALIFCGLLFAVTKVIPAFWNPWPSALVDRDFSNLWMAGSLAIDGRVGSIFDIEAFRAASREALGINFKNNYSYPPHSLFLAIPFGALPYAVALFVWNVGSLAFFYWAARPYIPKSLPAWVVVFSPASLMSLAYGHYGLLCGGLWLLAFRNKGWAAALLTIKPHLGLLVLVQMVRDRRGLISAVVVTLVLIGLSVLAFGIASWRAFLGTTFNYQIALLDGSRPGMSTNMLTPIIGYGYLGQAAFAVAAILLLRRSFNVFTAATATFLIIPYGFHYDLTVVCMGFAVLLATRWAELTTGHKIVACLAFLAPGLVSLGAWLIPPILLAGLYVQIVHAEKVGESTSGRNPQPIGQVHAP